MKKEVEVKVEVGDRIRIVAPADTYGEYENGYEGEITGADKEGVMVFFDHYEEGSGSMYVLNEEFEVIATDGSKTTAESLRNFILDIRSKREEFQKEILQLDEQEKEAVEKLKEQGFVLYEDNVSKELVATEKKTVLHAEDIEEDMTNYRNWEVGDVILCKSWSSDGTTYNAGDLCEMVGIEDGRWPKLMAPNGYSTGIALTENFEFHSRPVK